MESSVEEYDLIIIGGGPAGLTAGIYAGRQGMKAMILEMMTGAGSGYMVPSMENYLDLNYFWEGFTGENEKTGRKTCSYEEHGGS
jgi:thioredoxin reductase